MKFLILILFSVIFAVSANAQSKNSLVFGDALVKYKRMEKTGTLLTVIGGVALFTGNILYWKTYNDHENNEPQKDKVATYGHIMLGGFGLMAVGIPLWAVGKARERHITIKAELVKFKGLTSANGIGLKIQF